MVLVAGCTTGSLETIASVRIRDPSYWNPSHRNVGKSDIAGHTRMGGEQIVLFHFFSPILYFLSVEVSRSSSIRVKGLLKSGTRCSRVAFNPSRKFGYR